ncbi:MAG: stage III sporulation protein AD [Clostridia bacterium]|nr:stage III sporulation protein AD [Clostridia bacterium]
MSDTVFKLFGGAILCVLLLVVLRRESPDSAISLRMVAGVLLAVACVSAMTPMIVYVNELASGLLPDNLSGAVETLLKVLGVSLLTHISATVCRDSGEGSIASYVELGGKIEIMLLSLPLIKEIVGTALGLIDAV